MASKQELADFLEVSSKRAYKHALYVLRNPENALDAVQEAMLRLTEKYGDKPLAELPMLFQRILQNALKDHFRRQKVRSTWTVLLSALTGNKTEETDYDPLDTLEIAPTSEFFAMPNVKLESKQTLALLEHEIQKLPARQREAFLLRYWEEMDVATTAELMDCSEGSVKTHCSRAVHALSAALRAKGTAL